MLRKLAREMMREQAAKWGRQGAKKQAANMTAEQRTARAKKAARARWGKKK